MKTRKSKGLRLNNILVVSVLFVGIILGIWQVKPPRADEASPAYQRMMANIQRMAVEPHPAGSAEIQAVRAQLLAEIEEMGLSPIVEDLVYTGDEVIAASMRVLDTTLEEWWEENRALIAETYGIYRAEDLFIPRVGDDGTMHLVNILVKLDAPNADSGVMFVSHYDSTIGGPGAADDMVAVCSMLEAMREHAQGAALQNDIYFLFTDGEEDALLGAWRFVDSHPELKEKINMTVNLEARGNRGGLLLFETSPQAHSLIEAVIKSGAKPIGFSWLAAVYAMMPNITDLTAFLKDGYNGVNFAVAEGVETYHQPTDSYENLNRSTAWHYLRTTLAIADYAANKPLDGLREPSGEAVYFPLLPGFLVFMRNWVSHIICAAVCVIFLILTITQAKSGLLKISFSTVLMGLLFLLSIGSAAFFVSGSYLFYIPLLSMSLTAFVKPWPAAHTVVKAAAGVTALLLWVPVVFLLWISLVQPLMLQGTV